MHKILTISTIIIFSIACRPEVDKTKLAKIDSLQQVLDSNFKIMQSIDSTKMINYSRHYFENIDYIKNKFNDTVSTETAFFVDKYYGMRKAMKLMQKQYSSNKSEILLTVEQLNDLKHDAKRGLINESEFDKYLRTESDNINLIQAYVNEIHKAYSASIPLFEEMNPKIDSLILKDMNGKKNIKNVNS